MKRLLLISYPFAPNSSAGAIRSERFARHLAEVGWEVDVLTIRPREDLFKDHTRLADVPGLRVNRTATWDPWLRLQGWKPQNVFLRLLRSLGLRVSSFPDHMVFWLPFAVHAGLKIYREKGFEAIYTTSPPHSSHLVGKVLSRLTKKPWVADFRDPWTLNTYQNEASRRRILLKVEQVMEKSVLRGARAVLANTRANRDNLLAAFPEIEREKVFYLPNGWEAFPRPEKSATPDGFFTIIHAGTFYPNFKPYALFEALGNWKCGNQPEGVPPLEGLRLILLGSQDAVTRNMVNEMGLQEMVEIKTWMPLEEARKHMCQADALWVTLGTGRGASTYVPSKLFEYLAAGRPILGFFPEGEACHIIRETGTGLVFNSDEPGPIIRCLFQAMEEKKAGADFPDFYRRNENAIKELNVEEIATRFSAILNDLVAFEGRSFRAEKDFS
jgi:hypothetical protein